MQVRLGETVDRKLSETGGREKVDVFRGAAESSKISKAAFLHRTPDSEASKPRSKVDRSASHV